LLGAKSAVERVLGRRWGKDIMSVLTSEKQQELLAELEDFPEEYFPLLLQMIRTYRASVLLKPAADSFRQGWEEAQSGETSPVDRLWEGIDAE
jgi:hypothetical protein